MGNCLKSAEPDDVSLLRHSDATATGGSVEAHGAVSPSTSDEEGVVNPAHRQNRDPGESSTRSIHRAVASLSEEEQVKLAKRITIIQHLPLGKYDSARSRKSDNDECVICMGDFESGEDVRYLPCLHIYHKECIDDWLLRYLNCPSCMEPVDSALFSSFDLPLPGVATSSAVIPTSENDAIPEAVGALDASKSHASATGLTALSGEVKLTKSNKVRPVEDVTTTPKNDMDENLDEEGPNRDASTAISVSDELTASIDTAK